MKYDYCRSKRLSPGFHVWSCAEYAIYSFGKYSRLSRTRRSIMTLKLKYIPVPVSILTGGSAHKHIREDLVYLSSI